MCRNIRTLFNFEPPATEAAFDRAVEEVAAAAGRLIQSLVTNAEPRSREIEAARAKERSAFRFGGND